METPLASEDVFFDDTIDDIETDPLLDLQDHLLIAPPLVWLDVISRCDADRHDALIRWMLEQPECDFAVAFVAFHLGTPAYHLRHNISISPADPHRTPLALLVLKYWNDGMFSSQDLGVDPLHLGGQLHALRKTIAEIPVTERLFHVPPGFLVVPEGPTGPLSPEWSSDHDADVWDIYAAVGLRTGDRPSEDGPAPVVAEEPVKDMVTWTEEAPRASFWSSIPFLQ